jgi:Fe-S-cluster-containing hydrogenase component 2
MRVRYQICMHCAACAGSCPTNSIFLHETSAVEFMPTCTECGLCMMVCPVGAISGDSKFSDPPSRDEASEVRL